MVSPLGNSVGDSWGALLAGESGAGPITRFDADDFPVRFGCEVKDLDVADYVDVKASRRMDRCTHLALAAAREAATDSALDIEPRPSAQASRSRRRWAESDRSKMPSGSSTSAAPTG